VGFEEKRGENFQFEYERHEFQAGMGWEEEISTAGFTREGPKVCEAEEL
jgi:hypothetical protein